MTKTISLSGGFVALIDEADYEWLNQWKWCVNRKSHNAYACRDSVEGFIYMHRLILEIHGVFALEGDHINGNGLDNRRSNLRVVTHRQNSINLKLRNDNTSGVSGVNWVKKDKTYRARIYDHGKEIILGYSKSFDEAVAMRREGERRFYGEFVRSR